jgi:hypothetical protein
MWAMWGMTGYYLFRSQETVNQRAARMYSWLHGF